MKNINEDEVSCSFFDDPEIELAESENVDNPEYKKQLEKAFNSIINTNKEFKYIDEDHWYFCMD